MQIALEEPDGEMEKEEWDGQLWSCHRAQDVTGTYCTVHTTYMYLLYVECTIPDGQISASLCNTLHSAQSDNTRTEEERLEAEK